MMEQIHSLHPNKVNTFSFGSETALSMRFLLIRGAVRWSLVYLEV